MAKQQISSSSKLVDARNLAIYELDQLVSYMRTIDPELSIAEATVLAAVALRQTLRVFREDPTLVNQFKDGAVAIKHRRNTR